MTNIFTAPTKEVTAQQMADHIPRGRAWGAKNVDDSNTRLLINSLSAAQNRVQGVIQTLDEEFRIDGTTFLLDEWTKSVGLPTECYPDLSLDTIEKRREAVVQRFRRNPVVTLPELQEYVDSLQLPLAVVLYAGDTYEALYPGTITDDPKFVIVVEIPLTGAFEYLFEFEFEGIVDTTRLLCELNKVISTHVILLITYI